MPPVSHLQEQVLWGIQVCLYVLLAVSLIVGGESLRRSRKRLDASLAADKERFFASLAKLPDRCPACGVSFVKPGPPRAEA